MGYHKGDAFENIINLANKTYERKGIALIQKIATPMKPITRNGQIVRAYYEEKSTLDYIGVYNGIAIAFDAKETNEDYLPLKNIAKHQVEFMYNWELNGGTSFLVVNFRKHDKVFRIKSEIIERYWERWKENKGKRGFASIPINDFEINCLQIKSRNGIVLDYLDGLI